MLTVQLCSMECDDDMTLPTDGSLVQFISCGEKDVKFQERRGETVNSKLLKVISPGKGIASVCLSVSLSVCLSISLSVCLSVFCLSSVCLSVCLSLSNMLTSLCIGWPVPDRLLVRILTLSKKQLATGFIDVEGIY